jgi:hypothetical protein
MEEIRMDNHQKLEYIHATLQEALNGNNDEFMIEHSLTFIEDMREEESDE